MHYSAVLQSPLEVYQVYLFSGVASHAHYYVLQPYFVMTEWHLF